MHIQKAAARPICTNFSQAPMRSRWIDAWSMALTRDQRAVAMAKASSAHRSRSICQYQTRSHPVGRAWRSLARRLHWLLQESEHSMHKINIPQSVADRVVARCGTEHPHATLDAGRTALVVIDLQNGFMMEGVAHALCEAAVDIVPNVNRLAAAVRRTGGKVFWIQNTHDEACLTSWSHMHEMVKPEKRDHRVRSMSEGTLGHELWADLDIRPEDVRLQKRRFIAFIQGSSDLEARLRDGGYDTVLITGTVTNVCCESTARDAMMLNFRTIMVSDGNAAANDEEHNASLIAFYLTFGDVMATDLAIQCLERSVAAKQAAE